MARRTIDNVYDKITDVEKLIIKQAGKITLNKWIATTALTGVVLIIGWIFIFLNTGG